MSIDIKLAWADFKTFVADHESKIHYYAKGNNYFLFSTSDIITARCVLDKSTPAPDPSDQKDFEDNYQANANKPHAIRATQTLGTDTFSLVAQGYFFTPTLNTTSDWDYQFDAAYALKGGILIVKDATMGDYGKCQIVDKDNILGYGAGLMLREYVRKWYVPENGLAHLDDVSVGLLPAPGLYFRFKYTSVSAVLQPKCGLNLLAYEVQ